MGQNDILDLFHGGYEPAPWIRTFCCWPQRADFHVDPHMFRRGLLDNGYRASHIITSCPRSESFA